MGDENDKTSDMYDGVYQVSVTIVGEGEPMKIFIRNDSLNPLCPLYIPRILDAD